MFYSEFICHNSLKTKIKGILMKFVVVCVIKFTVYTSLSVYSSLSDFFSPKHSTLKALIILGQAHPVLALSHPNADLDTFMSIPARQCCNTEEVVQTFSTFLHSESGRRFSRLDPWLYQSNLQDIFTLSALPGAGCGVQPHIHSESTLWLKAVQCLSGRNRQKMDIPQNTPCILCANWSSLTEL